MKIAISADQKISFDGGLSSFISVENVKTITLQSVDAAFQSGTVTNVMVHRVDEKSWLFTFQALDSATGKLDTFALETQRGAARTWANPQNLFDFLQKRGVKVGHFILQED